MKESIFQQWPDHSLACEAAALGHSLGIENWKRENVLLDALPLNSVFSEPHQSNMCLKQCVRMVSCTYLKIAQDITDYRSCFVELFFYCMYVTNQNMFKSK